MGAETEFGIANVLDPMARGISFVFSMFFPHCPPKMIRIVRLVGICT